MDRPDDIWHFDGRKYRLVRSEAVRYEQSRMVYSAKLKKKIREVLPPLEYSIVTAIEIGSDDEQFRA